MSRNKIIFIIYIYISTNTRYLIFKPNETIYKWDYVNKNANVSVFGSLNIALTINTNGTHGVIGTIPLSIGSTQSSWIYEMHNNTQIVIGLVYPVQSLTTTKGAVVSQQWTVENGDIVEVCFARTGDKGDTGEQAWSRY